MHAGSPETRPASRAPVYVTLGFFAVAITLVLIGAMRSAEKPASTPTVTQPGTVAAPRAVSVIMRDYLFEPTPLALYPGETIRLTVFNAGLDAHELMLGDATAQAAWTHADAAATPPAPFTTSPPASVAPGVGGLRLLVGSGNQTTIDWTVPAGDSLLLQCHLPGHLERGMTGTVIVQAAGPSSTPGR
jgi:uncharacterized cupredoxin-like copper-binding protein